MDAKMQLQVFNHRWLCNRFLKKTFWHTTWSFLKWKLLKLYYYVKWQVILSWKYYSIKFSEVEKDLRSVYSYLISISNVGWNSINSMSACWQNNRIGDSVLHYSKTESPWTWVHDTVQHMYADMWLKGACSHLWWTNISMF